MCWFCLESMPDEQSHHDVRRFCVYFLVSFFNKTNFEPITELEWQELPLTIAHVTTQTPLELNQSEGSQKKTDSLALQKIFSVLRLQICSIFDVTLALLYILARPRKYHLLSTQTNSSLHWVHASFHYAEGTQKRLTIRHFRT